MKDEIFRQYDIRGIVGEDLDKDVAFSIGKAFGHHVKEKRPDAKRLSVGRDIRLSSEPLAQGLIDGILSSGLDVWDVGICPTPAQYFSLFHLDIHGGVMVTGSHNPPEYNGFKLSVGKKTIHGEDIRRIKEIAAEGRSASGHGKVQKYDILSAYKDYMMKEFSHLNNPAFKRLKIVVDAGNGTAGLIVPEILRKAGCEVVELYCDPDGNFPNHHPDPTVVEYIQDLIHETKRSGADMGVGYDGDSDRIGVVDREGEIVWGDQLMIVISRELLMRRPGAKVIGDVKCSQSMFDDIAAHGGVPIMWKTGHSLIKQKMADEGALMAGEFSGHIFIADRYFGFDDAVYTTLRLVEIMKTRGEDIRDLLSDVPKMFYTPEIRVACPEALKNEVVGRIVTNFLGYKAGGGGPFLIKAVDTTDGIRVVFEKGWGLVRMSNTQPVIVMRVEAEDENSLKAYRSFLQEELDREAAAGMAPGR